VLPLGDPTRDELPVFLRGPLDEAIDALPDGARLIARTDWVAAAVANTWPPRPAGPAYDALLRLLQRRKLRTLGSAGGATLVEVGPRPAD
ncbi:hypothetical protein, partial [Paraconexibacter sp.]|uniref:hypothetical protein n=1 Tax=Paraconexibacter sp. TaxID=2949640 RepID=UPI003569849F